MTISGLRTHADAQGPLRLLPRYRVDLIEDERRLLFGEEPHGESRLPSRCGELLTSFCELLERPTPQVLAFALDYGPLQVCARHSLPVGVGEDHDAYAVAEATTTATGTSRVLVRTRSDFCDVDRSRRAEGHADSVLVWRAWMRRFGGTRRLADAVRAGEAPRSADVKDAFYGMTRDMGLADSLKQK